MPDKVVLAYSGGLDTSVATKWTKDKYNLDVIGDTSPKQVEKALAIAKKMVSSGK
jgi:argininosuccinate synthase